MRGYITGHKHVLGAFFCLLLVHLIFARGRNIPINMPDELGYLANAATFAGYDWSNVVANTPYYGIGYSLLITPLFIILETPSAIYTGALIVNALLVSGIVFVVYDLNDRWLPNASGMVKLLIAICVCLYPSYVVYAKLVMAESLLHFLFWISVWLISRLERRNTGICLLLGLVMGCSYLVHYRMLAANVAALTTLVLMATRGKIRTRGIAYYFGGLISLIFVESLIHQYIIEHLYLGNTNITNTLSGSLSRINEGMLHEQIGHFIATVMGQSYYLMSASYLLVLSGFFFSLIIASRVWRRKDEVVTDELDVEDLVPVAFFMVLSLVIMMGISVVTLFSGIEMRADYILYGRYNEAVSVGLVYMGLIAPIVLGEKSRRFKILIWLSVATFAAFAIYMTIFVQESMNTADRLAPINMTGLPLYFDEVIRIDFVLVTACIITISALCMVLQRYRFKFSLFYYCAIFVLITYLNMTNFFQPSTDTLSEYVEIPEVLRAVVADADVDVYYYLREDHLDYWLLGEYYQIALPEVTLVVVDDLESVDSGEVQGYIIGMVYEEDVSRLPGAELIYVGEYGAIWANFENGPASFPASEDLE